MKLSFRLLLLLPLVFSAALVTSCTENGFTTPTEHGKIGGNGGVEHFTIPHGETHL